MKGIPPPTTDVVFLITKLHRRRFDLEVTMTMFGSKITSGHLCPLAMITPTYTTLQAFNYTFLSYQTTGNRHQGHTSKNLGNTYTSKCYFCVLSPFSFRESSFSLENFISVWSDCCWKSRKVQLSCKLSSIMSLLEASVCSYRWESDVHTGFWMQIISNSRCGDLSYFSLLHKHTHLSRNQQTAKIQQARNSHD